MNIPHTAANIRTACEEHDRDGRQIILHARNGYVTTLIRDAHKATDVVSYDNAVFRAIVGVLDVIANADDNEDAGRRMNEVQAALIVTRSDLRQWMQECQNFDAWIDAADIDKNLHIFWHIVNFSYLDWYMAVANSVYNSIAALAGEE